ncbi:hypothetical protein Hypma_016409 [Hypsizygus marmoreus]|uniref:Uncharacterized protein n=1 Tax=Hypsizygus marmoreus TaxID=39966 RepID=A0A369J4M8_HYPMA|nr:hypothetical protein Hypma_016409 [Hypsizygus marmoreus]
MYLGAQALRFRDTKDTSLIDAIIQWLGKAFTQLEHLLGEGYHKSAEWFLSVIDAANEPLKQHPYVALFFATLIFLGPWILLLPLFLLQAFFFVILYILGFGLSGIIGGSPAALYQSFCYGGDTPSSSMFAMLQSTGTHYNVGTTSNGLLLTIRLLAGVFGVYVLVAFIVI